MLDPVNYDQLYPGRFIKAGHLLGKKQMFTIKAVQLDELVKEDGAKESKAIVSFVEPPPGMAGAMQHVLPKTNGICLKAMFGPMLKDWIGKRIVLFESTWNNEPCIRIWGSADIEADLQVSVALPRRKPFNMTMRRVRDPRQSAPVATTAPDPRIAAAFELLDWNPTEQAEFYATNKGKTSAELLALLNAAVDSQAVS